MVYSSIHGNSAGVRSSASSLEPKKIQNIQLFSCSFSKRPLIISLPVTKLALLLLGDPIATPSTESLFIISSFSCFGPLDDRRDVGEC